MSTEVVKVELPNELKTAVQTSGIDLSEAQTIASGYAPLMNELQEEAEKIKGLDVNNPEDVAIAKRARIDIGKINSRVGKQKDDDKALIKVKDRFIMALHNTCKGFGELTQNDAKAIENHAQRLEDERIEALRVERMAELEQFDIESNEAQVQLMSDDVWKNYVNGVRLNYEQVKEAEKKAEQERIAKEKKEAEEREAQRLENIRLKKEAEALEKKIEAERVERERLAKIEADKQAKIQADADAKAKKEREAREKAEAEAKQAKAKADKLIQDAKDKEEAERIETERIAKEESDAKKAAEQAELKKGDSDKVKDLVNDLEVLKTKYSFKSDANKKKYSDTCVLIDKVIDHINK